MAISMSRSEEMDVLTGLASRGAFEAALIRELSKPERNSEAISVAVLDIDLFGRLNEQLGRLGGDAVLRLMAGALSAAAAPGSVYRFGGDAFGVLWRQLEKEKAFLVLERFREAFTGTHVTEAEGRRLELEVAFSAGIASFPDDGTAAAELMSKAAEALYRAKVTGRNKVCLAREEKMLTKTSHYTQGQLLGLRRLAEREGFGEAVLLREALNDLLRKYNA